MLAFVGNPPKRKKKSIIKKIVNREGTVKTMTKKRTTRSKSRKAARFVKGSAAAKAHMAKIRAMKKSHGRITVPSRRITAHNRQIFKSIRLPAPVGIHHALSRPLRPLGFGLNKFRKQRSKKVSLSMPKKSNVKRGKRRGPRIQYMPVIRNNPHEGLDIKALGITAAQMTGFSLAGVLVANLIKNKVSARLPAIIRRPAIIRAAVFVIGGNVAAHFLGKAGYKDFGNKLAIGSLAIGGYILASRVVEKLTINNTLPAAVSGLIGSVNREDLYGNSNQGVGRLLVGTPFGMAAKNYPGEVSRLVEDDNDEVSGLEVGSIAEQEEFDTL